jgi:hypothetical protein
MADTRKTILQQINDWTEEPSSQRIMWIHGLAGAGKTAIASSIAQRLEDPPADDRQPKGSRLGANFFCSRDFSDLSDPNRVLPSIACQLANLHPLFRRAFANAVRDDSDIAFKPIQVQFRRLFEEPFKDLSPIPSWSNLNFFSPCVIVIDALDECGSPDTREELLCCLRRLPALADGIRIVVTSRPDPDIHKVFSGEPHCRELSLHLDNDTIHDISLFVRTRMSNVVEKSHWPSEEQIKVLARRAEGLFIWAATACKYIEEHWDVERALGDILAPFPITSRRPYAQLDSLYTTVLSKVSDSNVEAFYYIIGALVTLRVSLPARTLCMLLQGDISDSAVMKTVGHLRSVLVEDDNGNIRVSHPSFVDFLTDKTRAPLKFYIDTKRRHLELAHICLQKVVSGVRFNLCDLETSYHMNAEVADLHDRIEHKVPADLRYSCVHWAGHLRHGSNAKSGGTVVTKVRQLLENLLHKPPLLYWLEVLSLLSQVREAISSLASVVIWIDVCPLLVLFPSSV